MAAFEELRRRRVFRSSAAYIVASWVILQVADLVFPILDVPEITLRWLLWLLVLGLPVVVITSWIFRVAPGGRLEPEAGRTRTAAILGLTLASLVVGLALGWVWSGFQRNDSAKVSGGGMGIAVLPLEDLSPGGDKAYFSDGVHEELIARLAQIDGLSVPSRTTMESFRGSSKHARQIAAELSVDYILEGSVRHGGDRVRITLQLIDAAQDEHVWVRNFEEQLTMESLFQLQANVATDIAELLQAYPTPSDRDRLRQVPTPVFEAYDAYLKGLYHYRRFNAADLRLALDYFKEATDYDPAFGRAWSGLANSYALAATGYGWLAPQEAIAMARRYGEKALELEPHSGATISFVGDVAYWYDYDAPAAEAAYRRGIDVDPDHAGNRMSYSYLLSTRGRFDEAIEQAQLAIELEPRSSGVITNLAWRLLDARRYEEAIDAAESALAVDPSHVDARRVRGEAYAYLGRLKEIEADPFLEGNWLVMALARAHQGERETALSYLQPSVVSAAMDARPGSAARVYAALGDNDRAFEYLDRAIRERHRNVLMLAVSESYDSLRDDPRYVKTLARIGLPTSPLF